MLVAFNSFQKFMKTTIKELPSGSIDLVLKEGKLNVLQFNSNCTDAAPYCQAACCRHRERYAALLYPDEVGKFKSRIVTVALGRVPVVASRPDGTCIYLTSDNKCEVHEDKPRHCKEWHCSPEGKGEGVTVRDAGWGLYSIMEFKHGS